MILDSGLLFFGPPCTQSKKNTPSRLAVVKEMCKNMKNQNLGQKT